MKTLKSICGFTATELLMITSILSLIPVSSYIGVREKALKLQCDSQLKNIGMAINMFTMNEGKYPDAKFYPEEPLKDPRSIVVILKPYGGGKETFICPTAPPVLKEKGLTYLWNDELSGKVPWRIKDRSTTWMMVDITAAHEDKSVSSHLGGYNILYADGNVAWSSEAPSLKPKK